MKQRQEIFTLMGGRVKMHRGTYNPTSDAVWLAAVAASRCGHNVLDVGVGTGGAALCIAAYCQNAHITGIDISDEMLNQCAKNAELNDTELELINTDIMSWRTSRTFDTVITNPPYFNGTPAKHNAHHNADIAKWVARCVARVRPRGTICVIVDALQVATVIAAIAHKCGDVNIYPLFGGGVAAERVIITGRVGVRTGTTVHQALPMNYSPILRDGLTIASALSTLSQHD